MEGIVKAAEDASRQLTDVEQAAFDFHKLEAKRLAPEPMHGPTGGLVIGYGAEEARHAAERERELADAALGCLSAWVDARTGRPVRVVESNQRLARAPGLSLGRLIVAKETGRRQVAERELDVQASGVSTGAGGSGGAFMVADAVADSFIDLARGRSVMRAAGARTIQLPSGCATIARVATDPTIDGKTELAAWSESPMTFDGVELNAITVGAAFLVSRELLADAPNAADTIDKALAAAMASKLDYFALCGSGAGRPDGLASMTSVNEVGSVGALADYDDFMEARRQILAAGGEPNAVIVSPLGDYDLGVLKTGIASDLTKLTPPKQIAELLWLVAKNCPEANAFVLDGRTVLIGLRGGIEVQTSPAALNAFEKNALAIRVLARVAVACEHQDHVTRLAGITS